MNHFATIIQPGRGVKTMRLPEDSASRLRDLQSFVGGYIEVIYLGEDKVMVLNEDGKMFKSPANATATRIAHDAGAIHPGDIIVGVAVITTSQALE